MSLRDYRAKRDFKRTTEPRGAARARKVSTFVIQRHDASHLHYDFRLEIGGVLVSWAVPKGPSLNPSDKRLAVKVEDHPLEYGKFEGKIPEGNYGAGDVRLWDNGTWTPEGDAAEGVRRGSLHFRLDGHKLRGLWKLVRMGGRAATGGKENWLLIKSHDAEARKKGDILKERPESVRRLPSPGRNGHSSRNGSQAPRGRARTPGFLAPQLATLVDNPPEGNGWIHETKFDGYRLLCRIHDGKATLFTRSGLDWTSKFTPIAEDVARLPLTSAILDGEAIVTDSRGVSSFPALQDALSENDIGSVVYVVFDLLFLDGENLSKYALIERKKVLQALLEKAPSRIRFSDHASLPGTRVYDQACRHGLEGIISKRADAPYRSGRGTDWLKSKCAIRQELVIGGFTEGQGSRKGIGALALGVFEKSGKFRYSGRVGTGFSDDTLEDLGKRFMRLETAKSPFSPAVPPAEARGVRWVRPELVAEVSFTQWTPDGRLRHPAFEGLREDKKARDVVREKPKVVKTMRKARAKPVPAPASSTRDDPVAGITITHPYRVVFPGSDFTKREVALYYESVADRILPHLAGRPLAVVRCPQGAGAGCFFQKNASYMLPDEIRRFPLREKSRSTQGIAIDDLPGIVSLVQFGALEFHPWGSRIASIEKPDRLTMDLDPAPGVAWPRLVEAARRIRRRLEGMGLKAFVKTTGGKGLHVVAPVAAGSWDDLKEFARTLAEEFVSKYPEDYVSTVSKTARTGRILIDWLRNMRGSTAVAAWSTRARPGGPVSTPVSWEELSSRTPLQWTVRSLPERLKKQRRDPWADFFKAQRSVR